MKMLRNSSQRENFALSLRKFTYSWVTNRFGTAWIIIKSPCEAAYQMVYGSPYNEWPAQRTFMMPDADQFFHDSNCGGVIEPLYPCADSYEGFNSTSMNLDMSKLLVSTSAIYTISFQLSSMPYFFWQENQNKH